MHALSRFVFVSSTAFFEGSRKASSRRNTVIGRMTSRYLPRTYRSRSTSSAIPHMKLAIQPRSPFTTSLLLLPVPKEDRPEWASGSMATLPDFECPLLLPFIASMLTHLQYPCYDGKFTVLAAFSGLSFDCLRE